MANSPQPKPEVTEPTPPAEPNGELSDAELENVSGGSGVTKPAEISSPGLPPPPTGGKR
jgi:hypothetical protein